MGYADEAVHTCRVASLSSVVVFLASFGWGNCSLLSS